MARNEKKCGHRPLTTKRKAQSTIEYVLMFPLLYLLLLSIFELAFMWHQYNSMEFVTREISANLAFKDSMTCVSPDNAMEVVQRRTASLHERSLTFTQEEDGNSLVFTSEQQYKGNPFVVVRINCTPNANNQLVQVSPTVQLQTVHELHFFSASLPNFRTGERIVIIPDHVVFTSTKTSTLSQL